MDVAEKPVWHLAVAYAGTNYSGWQIQPWTKTVQGEIQRRLRHLFRDDELTVAGTSRTDAGVHALDQHVTFTPSGNGMPKIPPGKLCLLLNRWLPEDIRILHASREPPRFHARHSAKAKAYTYAVRNGQSISPFESPFLWNVSYKLNFERLQEGAKYLEGTHDFAAFCAKPYRHESTLRTIHRFNITHRNNYLYFSVIGNAFLYKMVRTLIGYLVMTAGRSTEDWTTADIDTLFTSRQRPPDLPTAPPEGLFLAKVFFADDAWFDFSPVLPPQHWTPVT